jgi:hypothetical protein
MKQLKGLKIVLIFLLVVLALVIVRTTGKNRFKQDAQDVIETVKSNNFSIDLKDLKVTENQYLIVDLSKSDSVRFKNSVKIPFEKLLEETTFHKLKATENKILLVSDDNSVSAKAWVILNQLDFRNVYILTDEENAEILKYEFQPDTSARIE